MTWGRKQQMSWAFFAKYCDEAYAIIDAIDTAKKKRGIDAGKLDAFLGGLRKATPATAKKTPARKPTSAKRP